MESSRRECIRCVSQHLLSMVCPTAWDTAAPAGFLLLAAGDDQVPEGVVAARLSGRRINSVQVPDLPYFTALRVLDLSDNQVSRHSIHCLGAISLTFNVLACTPCNN